MMNTKRSKSRKSSVDVCHLQLYVMGNTSKSVSALTNLKAFCETHLKGRYRITVIDLQKEPERAREAQILAIPTVICELPKPSRTMIGDFSQTDHLLDRLDLRIVY